MIRGVKFWWIWVLRVATASALLVFLVRASNEWLAHPTLTLTLVIIGELVTLSIYLSARMARGEDGRAFGPVAVVSTLVATFFFYFVILNQGVVLAPLWLTASMQLMGIIWQIYAKLSLGRSFGLLPANRGIVTRGAYKVVRHPIYLGYFVSHMGFLLGSFSWYNLWLFSALYFFQYLRILEEEKLLAGDQEYATYMQKVKYRLLPGIL